VKAAVESPGQGRVLVVDGGGSLRRALLGGNLGQAAARNGWAGVVVDGCVRDVLELAASAVGVRALASVPLPTKRATKARPTCRCRSRASGCILATGSTPTRTASSWPAGICAHDHQGQGGPHGAGSPMEVHRTCHGKCCPPQAPRRDLQAVARAAAGMVTRNALFAAGVAMVPVPGLDWLTDVGVLVRLLPQINADFGLSPAQIERAGARPPHRGLQGHQRRRRAAGRQGGDARAGAAPAQAGGRAPDHAAGGQVRAAGGPGGVGGADLFGAEVRLRTAHPAVPWRWPGSGSCRRRRAATEALAATMPGSSGCSAAW
jgi:hypothetical protein